MAAAIPAGPMAVADPRVEQVVEAAANPEKTDAKLSMDVKQGYSSDVVHREYGYAARTDPTVTFEEYRYWAKIERALEQEENQQYLAEHGATTIKSLIKGRFSKGVHHENAKKQKKQNAETDAAAPSGDQSSGEKQKASGELVPAAPGHLSVDDAQWRNSMRALRTASWGTIFYLVTTDILGWSSTPFVFASVGYGPGVALYVIFGIFAGISGWMIWRCFLGLDSTRLPMLSFGDPFFRIYGPKSRHAINVAQALQQFLSVAVIIMGNAQVIGQLSNNSICFVACMIITMVIGMVMGNIRSLQRLGWLCNLSVWLNIVSFIIICVAAARNGPDYSAVTGSTLIKTIGPIKTFAGPPPAEYQQQSTNQFAAQFNGVDSMVYSYAGALLFVAFLAEMRHPWDFWKGVLLAQTFICVVYVFFGVFVYSFYGQYSGSLISQVVQPKRLQTVSNVLGLITAFFAIFLYFNIGLKTVYVEVFQEVFRFPPIATKKGRWAWTALGPIYWILAFVVAASVPNFNGIVSFVGGLLSLNFTYSFPALMYVGYKVQCSAKLPGEGYDPVTGQTTRLDNGWRRWVRGYKKSWMVVTPAFLYFLAGLACSGMGTWASVEGLKDVFGPGGTVATSWGCAQPV